MSNPKIPDKGGKGFWQKYESGQLTYVGYGQSSSNRIMKRKNSIDDPDLTEMLGGRI